MGLGPHVTLLLCNREFFWNISFAVITSSMTLKSKPEAPYLTPQRRILMMHVIVKTIGNDIWTLQLQLNFAVVVVLFLVLKVYELHLENLFLVSGPTQKYQKCHFVCQINGLVISFSHIRALVWPIICYIKVMGTMKHE